jgi:sulfonate transport system substrate-binding protein
MTTSALSSSSRRWRPLLWLIGSAALALLVLFAARTLRAQQTDTPKVIRITTMGSVVAGQRLPTGIQAVVVEQGYLERELAKRGVRVEWVPIASGHTGPLINEGFANGSIDIASYGDLPSIILNAAGVRTQLIVPNGIGTETYLMVPNGSTARSLSDLKGKRIAIHRGRPWELPLSRLIDSQGLSYDDFQILNLNPEAGAAALGAGKVDALCVINAHLLVEKGVGKIIWSTAEAPPDWKMRAELWAARSFVEKQPELTQIVASAYVRALHWASLDQNRTAMLENLSRNGTPISVLEKDYGTGEVWRARWSPLFDAPLLDHYRYAIDYSKQKKIIREGFDFRGSYDERFVAQALRELDLNGYWQQR